MGRDQAPCAHEELRFCTRCNSPWCLDCRQSWRDQRALLPTAIRCAGAKGERERQAVDAIHTAFRETERQRDACEHTP